MPKMEFVEVLAALNSQEAPSQAELEKAIGTITLEGAQQADPPEALDPQEYDQA